MTTRHIAARIVAGILAVVGSAIAQAQGRPDPKALIDAQKTAMASLSAMDGVWRGPASTTVGPGQAHDVMQTERIGPMLDGSIRVIEGRGYDTATGQVSFNAFGVVSYDPAHQAYTLHSYAQGMAGDFKLTPTADGYVWEIPAGPMMIRYTAVIRNGSWREVGDRIMPGQGPVRFFEMNLKRVGDSAWPGAGAIPMK